jgi:hypothetical protein
MPSDLYLVIFLLLIRQILQVLLHHFFLFHYLLSDPLLLLLVYALHIDNEPSDHWQVLLSQVLHHVV